MELNKIFKDGLWSSEINVRDFVSHNITPYYGDASFLEGPTERTKAVWNRCLEALAEERANNGVRALDNVTVSTITSHKAGYIDKENELIVGLQTDELLRRAIKPFGGINVVSKACHENGVEVDMPTQYGHFRLIPFRQKSNGLEHIALIKGKFEKDEPILVRVHSSCATGDIFGSMRCECGEQLHEAMRRIDQEGKGVIVYLNQEGRGVGLMEKMKAYKLQEDGLDTVDANLHLGHQADERDYGVGAQILRHIGVTKMRLMSNNPVKRVGLEAYGLEVVENVPIEVKPNPYNEFYMKTKKERMGHVLHNIK